MQAFQMYMSVYLTQPANLPCATKMLKYIEAVRGLAQEGADWRSYDGMGPDQLGAMTEGISN